MERVGRLLLLIGGSFLTTNHLFNPTRQRVFYSQLEKSLPAAYDMADFTMSANMVARDTEVRRAIGWIDEPTCLGLLVSTR